MPIPDFFRWVSAANEATKVDATLPQSKKNAGWNVEEPVAGQFLNWIFNRLGKWIVGFQHHWADIVVGSAAQVVTGQATHDGVADDWVAAIANGDRVSIIDDTTLTQNEDITETDVEIVVANGITLAASTFTFTLSGADTSLRGNLSGFGSGDLVLSGSESFFKGTGIAFADITIGTNANAEVFGVNSGLEIEAINADTITEKTSTSGVTIESVLLKDNGIQTDSGGTGELLRTKMIAIGDWDMDTTSQLTIAHGLDAAKIRSMDVWIIIDGGTIFSSLIRNSSGTSATANDGSFRWDTTNMSLRRVTGSGYDSASWSSTPFNRGWITLIYAV